jgi:uncharacterized protein GlcG (DUF336 family)
VLKYTRFIPLHKMCHEPRINHQMFDRQTPSGIVSGISLLRVR